MKAKDLAVVVGTAFITLAAAWTVFGPTSNANAGKDEQPQLEAKPPAYQGNGVVLTLNAINATFSAAEKPALNLIAENKTDLLKEVAVKVTMSEQGPAQRFARMVRAPKNRWSDTLMVALKPHEIRILPIHPEAKLTAGSEVSFTIQVGERLIVASRFNVPGGQS